MATTLGVHNPLRYRGYVYDEETALYYLQTRYYDPELGRFINADVYTSTGHGVLGNNMFAYCNNRPVRYVDSNGADPEEVKIGLNGFTYSVDEIFMFTWGTVTVIASYEVKIIDGCTFILDAIEIEVTDSDVIVTMPDGISFCFEYDWTGIKPDSYTKTISEELGLKIVLNTDGIGVSITNDTLVSTYGLQIQVLPSPLLVLIEKVAEALPPVGGSYGGGPWDIHNNTLMFE